LLVSCAPDRVSEVLNIFHTTGFSQAGVVGQVQAGLGLKITG
jgi:predicted transcriptional regulator